MKSIAWTVAALLGAAGAGMAQEAATPGEAPAAKAGIAKAAIADDPRIDRETGAELANYAPDNHFMIRHTRLELDIPDMGKSHFDGVETVTIEAVGTARRVLTLDAGPDLRIASVTAGGESLKFEHDRRAHLLDITLGAPLAAGETAELVIAFAAEYPHANGKGLTWTPGREGARSETDRWAQVHSQGEPEDNHTWYPCHDFPNQRGTTELLVTVEDGYEVGSNGRLVGTRLGTPAANGTPRTVWHWLQDKPHSSYLVSMVIGHFGIVGLPAKGEAGGATNMDGKPVCCYLYVPLGSEASAQKVYAKTPAMLAFYNERFGHKYAWDKYSQACVRNFAMGGMENTSATTMPSSSATMPAGRWDEVISHEFGHQWFGDLVTCKSWEHIWLNEGWATFCEALWAEEDAPEGRSRRAYQRVIARKLGGQRAMNRTYAPEFPAMVSKRWNDPFEAFMRPNDCYAKGGVILHMLRQKLGDEAFFTAVKIYLNRYQFTQVETDDFRHVLEEVSGLSLERFFDQWCTRPGLPRMKISYDWKGASPGENGAAPPTSGGGTLSVHIEQTQKIDAANPAYAFRLPLYLKFGTGDGQTGRYVYVDVNARETDAGFALDEKPADISVDPQLTVAAATSVDKPLAMWLEQLRDDGTLSEGGSVFAQLEAAEHLAEFDSPAATAALLAATLDEGVEDCVRRAAAESLLSRGGRLATAVLFR
jgi:aminopeptidase N